MRGEHQLHARRARQGGVASRGFEDPVERRPCQRSRREAGGGAPPTDALLDGGVRPRALARRRDLGHVHALGSGGALPCLYRDELGRRVIARGCGTARREVLRRSALSLGEAARRRARRGGAACGSTDDVQRAHRLRAAVDLEQRVQALVVEAQGRYVGESGGAGGQAQVLADVPAVDQRVAVAAVGVAPAVAAEDVAQENRCGRVLDRLRALEGVPHLGEPRA